MEYLIPLTILLIILSSVLRNIISEEYKVHLITVGLISLYINIVNAFVSSNYLIYSLYCSATYLVFVLLYKYTYNVKYLVYIVISVLLIYSVLLWKSDDITGKSELDNNVDTVYKEQYDNYINAVDSLNNSIDSLNTIIINNKLLYDSLLSKEDVIKYNDSKKFLDSIFNLGIYEK